MLEFCECGSIKQDGTCTNKHCPIEDKKSNRWIIGGREYKFKVPMTLDEAKKALKEQPELIVKQPVNTHIKPWIERE